MRSKKLKLFLLIIISALASIGINAAELPQHDQQAHMGVASCAASMCHGSIISREGSNVVQNEYIIWSRQDAHSQAYETLLTDESKKIANNLGLDDASKAGVCLDCHSDNVTTAYQGKKFQISDGVGCESCHGGAENYLSSHTDATQTHEQNIANGLYPTANPQDRARLCLSCHLGNENKQATHDIMGAGHPRLAFELDTFGILQPLHYLVDADYKTRKWVDDSYITWIYGQLEANRETLKLIENKLVNIDSLFPELSLFDCYACHHEMSDLKWNATKGEGAKPGTVRLNDGNFKMLIAIAASTPLLSPLHQGLTKLRSSLNNPDQLSSVVDELKETIQKIQLLLVKQSMDERKYAATLILHKILNIGSKGEFSDYIAAEQAVMAIDLLMEYVELKTAFTQDINDLFSLVKDDEAYQSVFLTNKLGQMHKRILLGNSFSTNN